MIISDCSVESPRNLDRETRESGIFKFLVYLVALKHSNERFLGPYIFQRHMLSQVPILAL